MGTFLKNTHAAEAEDCTKTKDVAEAGGTQDGTDAETAEHFGGRGHCTSVLDLNGLLGDRDGHDIAKDHHHTRFGAPGEGVCSSSQ